jgi:RNA polymerase sigma-70 factor, ECF subfamily
LAEKLPEDDDAVRSSQLIDEQSLFDLFNHHRPSLRRMVEMRLDSRLRARIDPSDVLQEAFIDISNRVQDYNANPTMPVYVWLRFLIEQRLHALYRTHLGAQKRDVRVELPLHGGSPGVTSVVAERLIAQLSTPSTAVRREERCDQLAAALAQLTEADQEVLVLRHFEELTNDEVAAVLGLKKSAASTRYIRALERLRKILESVPDFVD